MIERAINAMDMERYFSIFKVLFSIKRGSQFAAHV